MKISRRRSAVIKALGRCEKHITTDELYDRAKKIDPKIGYTTVWRTLKLLESEGLASPQKFHDGFTRYEMTESRTHHDHMVCKKCGRVEEFYNEGLERLQKKLAASHGFKMIGHKMELHGYCKRCKK